MTRGGQGGFYLQEDQILGYFQGQVAQTIIEQMIKTLRFQDEKLEEETVYALGGSYGRLQEGY
jgi:hypothetical protein